MLPQIGFGEGGQQNIKLKTIISYYLGQASGPRTPQGLPKISILCEAGRPPELILSQIAIGQGGQQNMNFKNMNLYYLGSARPGHAICIFEKPLYMEGKG